LKQERTLRTDLESLYKTGMLADGVLSAQQIFFPFAALREACSSTTVGTKLHAHAVWHKRTEAEREKDV
jgi:hypothetical protein